MGAPFAAFGLVGGGIAIALGALPVRLGDSLVGRGASASVLGGAGIAALYALFP